MNKDVRGLISGLTEHGLFCAEVLAEWAHYHDNAPQDDIDEAESLLARIDHALRDAESAGYVERASVTWPSGFEGTVWRLTPAGLKHAD